MSRTTINKVMFIMKLKKYMNLFVIEVLQLKFWLLFALFPALSLTLLERRDYVFMGPGLAVSMMMYTWIFYMFQAYKNEKQPLGIRLLLTTSYTRKDLIYSRYFTYLVIVVLMTILNVVYVVYALDYPKIIDFTFFIESLMFSTLLLLVLIPISFKCDTGNSFTFKSSIFFLPYELLCCEISSRINKLNIDSRLIFILAIVLILILFIISVNISKRIFFKKDL
mgnify:CR=1 FL=1